MADDVDLLKGSEARLWSLVDQRTRPGADRAAIDRRIWDLFGDTWAVMFTDLAGFSRGVAEFGIIHFLQIIHEHKRLLLPVVAAHDGILIKAEADSFLLLFRRPETALACARAMMAACEATNKTRAPEDQILLCVGLGYGKLLRIGDHDVFGAEVNAASKLGEDLASSGEILVTSAVAQALVAVADLSLEPLDVEVPGSPGSFRVR